jgi:two-component system, sensor histidine kinase PdtaS
MNYPYKTGDHVCVLFETEAERLSVAVTYLAEGFARGERCFYVGESQAALEQFRAALAASGIDAAAMIDRGALVEATKSEAHLIDGRFDSERMLRMLDQAVESALNDGFAGIRTCGDMSWLLDEAPGSSQVVEYEALLNQFFQNSRAVGMCQYDCRRMPPGLLDRALTTHPSVVVDRRHKPNPFYDPTPLAERGPHTIDPTRLVQLREQ